MKKILLLTFLYMSCIVLQAQIYINKQEGVTIQFFSKTPVEDISATNTKVVSGIDFKTDSIVVKILMNQFLFPNGLMQEHYNENYLETDKYPYATLKGKIGKHIEASVPGTYTTYIAGYIVIHNVKQYRTIPCVITVNDSGELRIQGKFDIRLADYKIKVPSIVSQKIAETVQVTVDANYIKKQ